MTDSLSSDDLAVIRSWAGSTVGIDGADQYGYDDIEARWARLHDPLAVAVEILRQRRADYLADPLTINLDGDYSANAAENVRALDRRISELERRIIQAAAGETGSITVGTMERSGPGR